MTKKYHILASVTLIVIVIVCLRMCNKQNNKNEFGSAIVEQLESDCLARLKGQDMQCIERGAEQKQNESFFVTSVEEQPAHDSNIIAAVEQKQQIEEQERIDTKEEHDGECNETNIPNIEMVYVEGGAFKRGYHPADNVTEHFKHQVTVSSFYIGKYLVTQSQWISIMGNNPSNFAHGGSYPVEGIRWIETQDFIKKLNDVTGKNYRLPTEAEWDFAAIGGNKSHGYTYSGSNNIDDVAWYRLNSATLQPVGGKAPNELGIYDMSGNVWEWCNDWFITYNRFAKPTMHNPTGPTTGTDKVIRGGAWNFPEEYCRVTTRYFDSPDLRRNGRGFRLAHSLEEE